MAVPDHSGLLLRGSPPKQLVFNRKHGFAGLENYVRFLRDTQAALFTGERLKNSSDGAARNVVRVRYVGRVETPLFV
jgi:hypothetical protein